MSRMQEEHYAREVECLAAPGTMGYTGWLPSGVPGALVGGGPVIEARDPGLARLQGRADDLLATAVQFLIEGQELEEAEVLLNCVVEVGERRWVQEDMSHVDITLRCKRLTYERLKVERNSLGVETDNALKRKVREAIEASLPSGYRVANLEARASRVRSPGGMATRERLRADIRRVRDGEARRGTEGEAPEEWVAMVRQRRGQELLAALMGARGMRRQHPGDLTAGQEAVVVWIMDYLREFLDYGEELDTAGLLACEREVSEKLRELEAEGLGLYVGSHTEERPGDDGSLPSWQVPVVVIECPKRWRERVAETRPTGAKEQPGAEARYVLRKGHGAWRLVFDGEEAEIKDQKGLHYVAHLLLNPDEGPMHGTKLGEAVFGHQVVMSANPQATGDDSFEAQQAARRECQAVLEDPEATEVERREAQAQLDEIEEWARTSLRGREGNDEKQVRAIRASIRRLVTGLAGAVKDQQQPHKVLRSFAEHLGKHLLTPSSSPGGRSARVRSGVAGKFVYEPPAGVTWSG